MVGVGAGLATLLGSSQLLYLAVMLTLGVRLLRRAVRGRQLPESLLAVHFLLCCSVGYLLLVTGLSAARDPALLPAAFVPWLLGVGQLCSCVGVLAGIAFNQLVFRRDTAWARGLVALAAFGLAAGSVGYGLTGGFVDGRAQGFWYWLFYGTYIAGAGWVMVEPLRYHREMRKRLQLGLAEPLVVNRLLLWGVGSVFRFLMVTGGAVLSAGFGEQHTVRASPALAISLVVIALLGLGVAGSYWLTFFPPRRYVHRIEGGHRASA